MMYFCPWKFVLILANCTGPDKFKVLRCISSGSSLFAKLPVYGFPVYKGFKGGKGFYEVYLKWRYNKYGIAQRLR